MTVQGLTMADEPVHFKLDCVSLSHVGCVRKVNEDSYHANAQGGIFAVADGMGGHERGEWASASVAQKLSELTVAANFDTLIDQTAQAIHAANAEIFSEATDKGVSMGTTVVALGVAQGRFGVVWAGDSRAYILRNDQFLQLSRDHTRVQELIDRGLLTPAEAEGHPMGHVLSRAVGVQDVLEIDAIADEVEARDIFLLCSDGLYGLVKDSEMSEILSSLSLEASAHKLVEMGLERGAPDNITVILIKVNEPTRLHLAPSHSADF